MPGEISREDWLREPSREELERHAQYGDPIAAYALALLDELEAARVFLEEAGETEMFAEWRAKYGRPAPAPTNPPTP